MASHHHDSSDFSRPAARRRDIPWLEIDGYADFFGLDSEGYSLEELVVAAAFSAALTLGLSVLAGLRLNIGVVLAVLAAYFLLVIVWWAFSTRKEISWHSCRFLAIKKWRTRGKRRIKFSRSG